jgi:hypothetical protein
MIGTDEVIEEDEYEVAGKLYEDFKHVFAYFRATKVERYDSEAEQDSEVHLDFSSLRLNSLG